MQRRKIAVITGTRAEFGLLAFLMKEIREDPVLELQIIATGTHYSETHGMTYREIERAGFRISAHFSLPLDTRSPDGICQSVAMATAAFSKKFEELKPDAIVLLGDRYEVLAAAQAALIHRIPVAHLHGGELTEGLIDEAIRHSVTKMSHLHFVATEDYRRRVVQLGETPERVFNFGAMALDPVRSLPLRTREEMEAELGYRLDRPFFLVTYHPVTLEKRSPRESLARLFRELDRHPDTLRIFTMPNADTQSDEIIEAIESYARAKPEDVRTHTSLGQRNYFSLIRLCRAVVGNSSSGLIEAPLFHVPTIDIGDRQKGRLRAPSVVHCDDTDTGIAHGFQRALSPEFAAALPTMRSPYDQGGDVAVRIKDVLKEADFSKLIRKKFFDLETKSGG
jgi:UDP-N-acetylglucosamine 2-epimerase (non-hydrolysing)/GDP/UDP-N,N'-diacetylbacillosamine 2-epimerase (hydrolysing)